MWEVADNRSPHEKFALKDAVNGADRSGVRLIAAMPRAAAARRQRAWTKRFDGPPPALAVELVNGVLRAVDGGEVDERVLGDATAFGVLRAHQGHAVGSLLDDITALRGAAGQRRTGLSPDGVVDAVLAAAVTGYVEELTAILQSRATRDPLTGLPNRAAFAEVLTHEIAGAGRTTPPALLLVDLDGFKAVNDRDGHLAGDAILRSVAHLMSETARRSDVACRLGGDEFAVVLPRTSQRQALHAARRLLTVARSASELSSATARVTFSLGLGWLPDPASLDELVAVADAALYRAKAHGGDGVEMSRPDDRPQSLR